MIILIITLRLLIIIMLSEKDLESLWLLSALDKGMNQFKNNPQMFCKLFERKKIIIDALQSLKIDVHKYQKVVVKAAQSQNPQIKLCAQKDIMKLKDPKSQAGLQQWWREIIQQTGSYFDTQQKLYQRFQKKQNITASGFKGQKKQQKQPESNLKQQSQQVQISLKLLDSQLQNNDQNKQNYQRLLQKKKNLLNLIKTHKINHDFYKQRIEKLIKQIKNQNKKSDLQFQISGIQDFHDGNVEAWFKQLVQQAQNSLSDQEEHLLSLKTGKKEAINLQKSKIHDLISKSRVSVIMGVKDFDLKEITSFKTIENALTTNEKNIENYRQLLKKKKVLLQMAKKGQLNGQKYKKFLQKQLLNIKTYYC